MYEKYRLLIENLPDAYAYQQLITDSEGNFVDYVFLDINTAFTEMTGLPRNSVLHKKVTEVLPGIKEAAFDWIGTYGKVALSGETVRFEEYFEPLKRWYKVTAYSDAPGYFGVVFRDTTKRKKAEESFQLQLENTKNGITEQEQVAAEFRRISSEYETVFHGTQNALFLVDVVNGNTFRYIRGNQAHIKATGFSVEYLSGKTPQELLGKDVGDRIALNYSRCVQTEAVISYEETLVLPAGKRTWFTTLTPIFIQGKIAYIVGCSHDITEQKQVEEALRVSEERYRLLVDNANEAIVVIQDGYVKYANPMAVQIFGCSAEKIMATPYIDFIHRDDRDIILERRNKRRTGVLLNKPYTFRLITDDGSLRHMAKSSVQINWEGNSAILGFMLDITELKMMEQEIFKADKLNSIGVFAGGIAHDLNNYLAVLLANASLAKLYTNDPQKVQEKLENMEQATQRAKDLSNQLFTFAKGAVPVKKTVSLNQSIIDNINFTLSGSNISCDYSIAENLHHVETDEAQFGQVLNNIALNAVQAMPKGGTIRVTADNFINEGVNGASFLPLPEGNYIKVTIQDKGIGIPEKDLQKIFDPFFTTKQKGSGLGLATSYTIMQNHGGHIFVTSKTGVGTTFHLYLPASTKTVTVNTATENVVYGRGRILVMDDQEDYLTVTGEILATLGYEASVARDGREAITIYMEALTKGQPFDLVIMDLTIPGGMGGKDTIEELLQKVPEVKAIVASGYSNDPIMGDFSDYGFKGVLKKPFALAELSMIVSAVIG